MNVYDRCILITNGNLTSMISIASWLKKHGNKLVKTYITKTLPSEKSNVRGGLRMLKKSGWDYTYMKVWVNKLFPLYLRRRGLPSSVEELLYRYHKSVSISCVPSVNVPKIINEIKDIKGQLIISINATERFNDPLIEAPQYGAINVHYGALPAYAGLSPYFWHLYNKEKQFGVTLHKIVSKLDAGPIIEQVIQDIGDTKTCLGLLLKMVATVSPMLNRFFDGEMSFDHMQEQDLGKRSYFRHPTKPQVAEFKAWGYRMMDKPAKRLLFARVCELVGE